jgi:hypothetical protein
MPTGAIGTTLPVDQKLRASFIHLDMKSRDNVEGDIRTKGNFQARRYSKEKD